MKKTPWIAAASTLLVCAGIGSASAHGPWDFHRHDADDFYGRVVYVEPIVRRVDVERPRRECRLGDTGYRIAGATVAGGVIGGAIGHQLGHGENRAALTLLGSVVGSVIANQRAVDHAADRDRTRRQREDGDRCWTVREHFVRTQIVAYRVVYAYRGGDYVMRMRERPGPRIRIRGALVPAGAYWEHRRDRRDDRDGDRHDRHEWDD